VTAEAAVMKREIWFPGSVAAGELVATKADRNQQPLVASLVKPPKNDPAKSVVVLRYLLDYDALLDSCFSDSNHPQSISSNASLCLMNVEDVLATITSMYRSSSSNGVLDHPQRCAALFPLPVENDHEVWVDDTPYDSMKRLLNRGSVGMMDLSSCVHVTDDLFAVRPEED